MFLVCRGPWGYPPNLGGEDSTPKFREWAPENTVKQVFFEDPPPNLGGESPPPNLGGVGFQGVFLEREREKKKNTPNRGIFKPGGFC